MAIDISGNPWKFDTATQGEGAALADTQVVVGSVAPEADDEIFTMAGHGFVTGDGPIQITGTIPTGLALLTDYWVIKIDADTFYVAASRALALVGTNLAYTSDGGSNFITRLATVPIPIFVKTILIESGSTGGTFEVTESSGGRTLTGALSLAANSHEQIVINDYVKGVYMTSLADGKVLVFHGR